MAQRDYAYSPIASDAQVLMRLDKLSLRKLLLIAVGALAVFALCIGVACLAPEMYELHKGEIYQCAYLPQGTKEDCIKSDTGGDRHIPLWVGTLRDVGPESQFLIISADVFSGSGLHNSSAIAVEFELYLGISLAAELSEDETVGILTRKQVAHRIRCKSEENVVCDSVFLGYLPFVEFHTYEVMVSLDNWEIVKSWISKVDIKVRSVAPAFSRFQKYFKNAFFVAALISELVYFYQLLRVKAQKWSPETRGLVLVSVSCLFFNDPCFNLSLNYSNIALTTLSVFCVVQFVGVLGYFWSEILLEIRPSSYTSCARRVVPVYLSVLCGLLVALYVYLARLMKNDPSYSFYEMSTGMVVLAGTSLGMTAGYVLWVCFLTVRAMPAMEELTKRKMFLAIFNLIMAFYMSCCVVAGALQRSASIGAAVLIVVAAFNLYTFLMQILLVPTSQPIASLQGNSELALVEVKPRAPGERQSNNSNKASGQVVGGARV